MKKKFANILLFVFLFSLFPQKSEAVELPIIKRISGRDRYETSAELSRTTFRSAETIILTSGEDFPDGLTGSVLASSLKAPLLITAKNSLPQSIEREIRRLQAQTIYILGGEGAISKKVEESLSQYKIIRISGRSRIETAEKVARRIQFLSNTKQVGLAGSHTFADSLSAAALLSRDGIPLLLNGPQELDPINNAFLKDHAKSISIFGGNVHLSNELRTKLAENYLISSYSGRDRYQTSADIAFKGFSNLSTVVLVDGTNFPDSLSAGSLANNLKAPILLASRDYIHPDVLSIAGSADNVMIVGGEGTVGDSVIEKIKSFRSSKKHKILSVADGPHFVINYYGKREEVSPIGLKFPDRDQRDARNWSEENAYGLFETYIDSEISLSLDVRQRGWNGEILAYLYDGDTFLNEYFLREGYLVLDENNSNVKELERLKKAEDYAKTHKKGLWQFVK